MNANEPKVECTSPDMSPTKRARIAGHDKFTKEASLTLVGTFTAMMILGI